MSLFVLLFWPTASTTVLGIDFGSHYTKAANIHRAFRLSESSLQDFPPSLSGVEHEIGSQALALMSSHVESGSGFFSAFVDMHNEHVREISHYLGMDDRWRFGRRNMTAAFLLFYVESMTTGQDITDIELCFVVPASGTIPQRRELIGIAEVSGVGAVRVTSDMDAMASLYLAEGKVKGSGNGEGLKTTISVDGQHFVLQTESTEKIILFVDVGAMSVKAYVTAFIIDNELLADVHGPVSRHMSYENNNMIGGAYATRMLADYIASAKMGVDGLTQTEQWRLFDAAETIKLKLSLLDTVTLTVDDVAGKSYLVTVTRRELEEVLSGFIMGVVDVALLAVGEIDIDEVEIIGGSSRIPKIQQTLQRVLKVKRLGHSLDADQALSIGAVHWDAESAVMSRSMVNSTAIWVEAGDFFTFLCNGTMGCRQQLVFNAPSARPEIVRLGLEKRDGQHMPSSFDKRLMTSEWNITLPPVTVREVNATVLFTNDGEGKAMTICTKKKCTTSPMYINIATDCEQFVMDLSTSYKEQKESWERRNTLEQLFLESCKETDELGIVLKPHVNGMRGHEQFDDFCALMKNIKRMIDEQLTKFDDISREYDELAPFLRLKESLGNINGKLSLVNDCIIELEVIAEQLSDKIKKEELTRSVNLLKDNVAAFRKRFGENEHEWELFEELFNEIRGLVDTAVGLIRQYSPLIRAHVKALKGLSPTIVMLLSARSWLIKYINKGKWFFNIFDLL